MSVLSKDSFSLPQGSSELNIYERDGLSAWNQKGLGLVALEVSPLLCSWAFFRVEILHGASSSEQREQSDTSQVMAKSSEDTFSCSLGLLTITGTKYSS